MQVTETLSDGLKREFKVVVDSRDIADRISDRLEGLRKSVRMPGFRPGKVPLSLLRKKYGPSILGEILEQAVNQSSAQALAEKDLRPAMQPKIEVIAFDEGVDLEYTMAVELLPDFSPGDLREIELTRDVVTPGDKEVDSALASLASREKNYVPVTEDRAAAKGDALLIDFVGKIDGVTFEGGSSTDHVLELGTSSFIEGFEDQLIGARPGDHLEVKLNFPDDYLSEELAGKPAVFEVDVKEIQSVEPVAIDEAFAQGHGFESLSAMRDAAKEQITGDYANASRAKLKRKLLDVLAENHDFDVPAGMVDAEFDAIWQRVTEHRADNQLDDEDADRSDDELRAEYHEIAVRRVRLGLLLSEIGRLNNIAVEPEEVNRAVMERAKAHPGQEQAIMDHFREHPEAVAELRAPMFENKVVDFIIEMAKITENKVSVEDLMRDPDEAETGAKSAKSAKSAKKSTKKAAGKAAKKPAKTTAAKTAKKSPGKPSAKK